ncbi:MAG TPA: HNH endonuclease [Gemmataceae bacterium]|jgi:hypothetical protein
MKHFVGYHNYERMEEEAAQEIEEAQEVEEFADEPSAGDNARFAFVTRKKPERFVGQVIWGIQGQYKPREYYLFDWFIVDGSEVFDGERFAARVYGSRGETFPKGIYLNDLPWFPEFRKVNSNFSLGIQEIAPKFVKHICELVKASGFPLPPGCEELLQAETSLLEGEGMASTDAVAIQTPDGQLNPERRPVTINQIPRDKAIVEEVKRLHNYRCQVCGIRLETPEGWYAQCAHIRPLGEPHNGLDRLDNVLCLCPNHHVLFDAGAFSIAGDLRLLGMEGTLRTVDGHSISKDYLYHHRNRIYRPKSTPPPNS